MGQGENRGAVNMLILGHVPCNHRKTQINTAQKRLNFNHFRHIARRFDEIVKGTGDGFVQEYAIAQTAEEALDANPDLLCANSSIQAGACTVWFCAG